MICYVERNCKLNFYVLQKIPLAFCGFCGDFVLACVWIAGYEILFGRFGTVNQQKTIRLIHLRELDTNKYLSTYKPRSANMKYLHSSCRS